MKIQAEKLWRTFQYEGVNLRDYNDGLESEINLARILWWYCEVRPHSSLGGKTLQEVNNKTEYYFSLLELTMSETKTFQ